MDSYAKMEKKKEYYISTFDKKLILFKELLDSRNFKELKNFGHKLKGSGKSFGFDEISKLGKRIEDLAINMEEKTLIKAYEELKDLFEYIKSTYNKK
ncbi:MAG: Hpt domain-containing protein [bacterium]